MTEHETIKIQKAINIIQNDIQVTKTEQGFALNLACKNMEKILVIRDIIDECYEGWITDLEANRRIRDLLD